MSTQRTMSGSGKRLVAAGLTAAMALAACGGGDDDSADTTPAPATEPPPADTTEPEPPSTTAAPATTAAPTTTPATTTPATPDTTEPAEPAGPVTVYSEDGNVALTVSAADAERVNPTVRVLDPSEWPPELGDAEQLPGVTIYEMEPDGAEFDEPVVVSRRLDMSAFGDSVDLASVPLVVPFTQEADGAFTPLDDLTVSRVGDDLYASGTTTHFSPLGTVNLSAAVTVLGDEPLAIGAPQELPDLSQLPQITPGVFPDQQSGTVPLRGMPAVPFDRFPPRSTTPTVSSLTDVPLELIPDFAVTTSTPIVTPPDPAAAPSVEVITSSSTNVPGSPLFADPGDVPDDLAIAVNLYITSLEGDDGAESERLRQVAEDLAAKAGLRFEVVHNPLFSYPSYFRLEVDEVEMYEDVSLFATSYTGEFGPDAQLIDISAMEWADDAYVADVGLTSYGDVYHGLIVAIEDTRPIEELTPLEYFDQFWSTPEAIMALFIPDPFPITSEEGVIFEGPAGYQISDKP